MRIMVIILAAVMLAAGLSARELTLSQALSLAREHAFTLKKADAASEAAIATRAAARSERWPTVSLAAGSIYLDDVPQISLGPLSPRPFGSKESYQTDVRASLPLWTGGRIGGGVDLAQAGLEFQQASAKGDSDRLDLTVWSEYFGLVRAQQLVEVAEASRKRAQIIASNVQSLFDAGAADSIDLNEAHLALVRAAAGVTQAGIQQRSAGIRLAVLTGLDPSDSLAAIQETPEPDFSGETGSPQISTTKSELRAAQAGTTIGRARVKLTAADLYPTLTAFGGYSYGKPNQDRFNNSWNDYWTVGANLNWSFNLGGKSIQRRKSARYELAGAQIDQDRITEQVNREARLAAEQVRLMFDKYQTARTEYDLASTQYRLAHDRHRNGDLSSNRLLEIETGLTSAQSAKAASQADYWMALALWYYATGSTRLQEGL
ncbi:MAG: TolC family protein [candidate division Zixibacteria bacterium]|nr:TolC family protein [candidate division Zixibacteria bacterium]